MSMIDSPTYGLVSSQDNFNFTFWELPMYDLIGSDDPIKREIAWWGKEANSEEWRDVYAVQYHTSMDWCPGISDSYMLIL